MVARWHQSAARQDYRGQVFITIPESGTCTWPLVGDMSLREGVALILPQFIRAKLERGDLVLWPQRTRAASPDAPKDGDAFEIRPARLELKGGGGSQTCEGVS